MIFSWLWVLYRGHPLFFLEGVYFSLFYPSLIFDMFLLLLLCVCVCTLEWFWVSLTAIFPICVCECVSRRFFCVFMCGNLV